MKYNRKLFHYNSRAARNRLKESPLFDPYNGRMIKPHESWDAEHILPLKTAWELGFKYLYVVNEEAALVRMKDFANDQRNLIATKSSSNRQRGDKTLWNWCPLNLAYLPERNQIIRELVKDYGLNLTESQLWALTWSDRKLTGQLRHGIHMGKTRAWLIKNGFYRWLMPY